MSNSIIAGFVGFMFGVFLMLAAISNADVATAKRGFDRIDDQLFCRVIDPPAECRL